MKFPEIYKVVPVANYLDIGNAGATVYTDSINMKGYHHATFICIFDGLGTASAVMTAMSGSADATYDTAETFNYAFGGAATGTGAASTVSCDVLAASTSTATLTITHGDYEDFMLIVEIDASAMTTGQEWLALKFTDAGSVDGNVTIFAILEPRYTGNRSKTALV